RIVADRQVARREDPLEVEPDHARLRVDQQRMLVELEHLIEPRRRDEHARPLAVRIAPELERGGLCPTRGIDPAWPAAGADRMDRASEPAGAPDHLADLGRRAR